MNTTPPLLLLGIGTAGVRIARGVSRAFGDELRYATADTDASSAQSGDDFTLLGGDRLAGENCPRPTADEDRQLRSYVQSEISENITSSDSHSERVRQMINKLLNY